jgi:hypothetical protein
MSVAHRCPRVCRLGDLLRAEILTNSSRLRIVLFPPRRDAALAFRNSADESNEREFGDRRPNGE